MQVLRFVSSLSSLVALAYSAAVGGPSGIYDSSFTPKNLPWNTYNYCNAPHVNSRHYERPQHHGEVELVYFNIMFRHHKRSPDNLFPLENMLNPREGWDCTDFLQSAYGELPGHDNAAHIFHETSIPADHPFLRQIWNGTCDVGQLTSGGFEDAVRHGQDLRGVYIDQLRFLRGVNEKDISVRSSTSDRTYAVSGAILFGLDPSVAGKPFKVHSEPPTIDSLVPSYSCPGADAIRNAFQSVPAWTDHLEQNADLQARLEAMLGTTGLAAWEIWYDHYFDVFTSRTCNGHPLPCNSTGHCVSQADADRVHAIGDFEYNYIWKDAQNATEYNSLTFGVMFKELAQNFINFKAGKQPFKAHFYSGHDGSMIRLASGLGIKEPLRWPALGSEIVMEVWKTKDRSLFVRVMHEGTPAEGLEWIDYEKFVQLLQSNVPDNLFERCNP